MFFLSHFEVSVCFSNIISSTVTAWNFIKRFFFYNYIFISYSVEARKSEKTEKCESGTIRAKNIIKNIKQTAVFNVLFLTKNMHVISFTFRTLFKVHFGSKV